MSWVILDVSEHNTVTLSRNINKYLPQGNTVIYVSGTFLHVFATLYNRNQWTRQCKYMYVWFFASSCLCMYLFMYKCVYVRTFVRAYVRMYACMPLNNWVQTKAPEVFRLANCVQFWPAYMLQWKGTRTVHQLATPRPQAGSNGWVG